MASPDAKRLKLPILLPSEQASGSPCAAVLSSPDINQFLENKTFTFNRTTT